MALDAKEVLEFLGYKSDEIKDINDLKTKFDSEFVRAKNINEDIEPVKKILGQTYSTIENEAKKSAKNFGLDIDFESDEFKGLKKASEKFSFVMKKLAETKDSAIEELKANSGKGSDEKVKEWEKKYEKIKKAKEDAENLLNGVKTEYDNYKQSTANEIKNVKLNVLKKDALNKVKFKPDISDFERKGYLSTIEEKYQFDIDENESLIPMDKKGNKIPSTKVTGTFKTVDEILQEEAINGKLYALNPDGGKPKPVGLNMGQNPPPQNNGMPPRKVAPRMG